MPLDHFLQKFSEALFVLCFECRIWNPWSKPEANLEEFNYQLIGPVRNCAFNKVYRCRQRDTNQIVVIKEIIISDGNEALRSSIIRKLNSLQKRNHENIVRLLRILTRRNYVYLVYESFTTDLCYFIRQPNNHRNSELRMLLCQLLSAVAFYHSHGILHGDLKPQYLLIDFRDRLLKLADFGLASAFGDPSTSNTIATFQYSAPELLLGSRRYSMATDMWSVGCIFGEMVTGRAVFEGMETGRIGFSCKSEKDQLRTIFRLLGTPSEDSWPGVTALCSSLSSFPKFEPMDLTVKFRGLELEGLDLLSKMLCLDPNKRISAKNALNHAYIKNLMSKPLGKIEAIQEIETSSQQVESSTD